MSNISFEFLTCILPVYCISFYVCSYIFIPSFPPRFLSFTLFPFVIFIHIFYSFFPSPNHLAIISPFTSHRFSCPFSFFLPFLQSLFLYIRTGVSSKRDSGGVGLQDQNKTFPSRPPAHKVRGEAVLLLCLIYDPT